MKKVITTLVRCGQNYTYVSRSFDRIDEEAVDIIRGCIEEDFEDVLTKELVEKCFKYDLKKLMKDYKPVGNEQFPLDFEHEGAVIWEYSDGIETIRYKLHDSIIELHDADTSYEAYIKSKMKDYKPGYPKEQAFADTFLSEINHGLNEKEFARALCHEHPTIQQMFFRLVRQCFVTRAEERAYSNDERNEGAVRMCRELADTIKKYNLPVR